MLNNVIARKIKTNEWKKIYRSFFGHPNASIWSALVLFKTQVNALSC